MPVASEQIWNILYMVSRYLLPVLAAVLVFLVLLYILSESRSRRERVRSLPGSGTVGELMVLSGSRELDAGTWFPVPREGVLGSVRSCDLVIPCPGVRTKHLDFSWEDGTGLLIRPRTGCDVQINGVPVTCRTRPEDVPLTHGGVLQVGSALLRLRLFAALNPDVSLVPPVQEEVLPPEAGPFPFVPYQAPAGGFVPPVPPEPAAPGTGFPPPVPGPEDSFRPEEPEPQAPGSADSVPAEDPAPPVPVRPRRSDRWKEDLGE